jgi:50S ribosomal subunit-associated GTPase HflX
MAANKSDLIEKEQVNEGEARKYAKEVGALFKVTSACTSAGIEELFRSIGCKILNPNYSDEDDGKPTKPTQQQQQTQPTKNAQKDSKIKLGDKKQEKKKEKRGFC